MAAEPAFMPARAVGRSCALLLASLILCVCDSGDLSSYLSQGRCDASGRCAAGYVCDSDSWECFARGTVTAGGNAGAAGASSAISGTAGVDHPSEGGSPATGGGGHGGTEQPSGGGLAGAAGDTAA